MEKARRAFKNYRGKKTQRQCARELGVTDKHLSRVLCGRVGCGKKLAVRIDEWSGGALPAVMFLLP